MDPRRPLWERPIARRSLLAGGFVAAASSLVAANRLLGDGSPASLGPLDTRRAVRGEQAPAFALKHIRTGSVGVLPQSGTPALLSFSATWCLSCVAELRNLQEVQHEFQGRASLAVVNFRQEEGTVLNLVDRLEVPDVPILLDSNGAVTRAYRVNALPAMALIDAAGMLREVGSAFLSPALIRERLALLWVQPR